ncbi:aminopeptidase N [Schaalia sp. ZJ405]|uniref:aminopeptidase N n=1 Tax=Schaalia sp. ZJ405 TaxID=2709403 RepID=UPI0013EC9D72|nr:aminopeptidase N [Schaalia sp. ZJ405]QPK80457.1 aminopeptidase N [Schaalia sp. ZJ405]
MQILTREQARTRSQAFIVDTIDVTVDVRQAEDLTRGTYPVTSVIRGHLNSTTLFIDVVGKVSVVLVNDHPHHFEVEDDRVVLDHLEPGELSVSVEAECRYSRTGEGLHRYRDPEDGRTYLYTQFEPNDAHRAWPCIDQPDVKARWQFTVLAPQGWVVANNGERESLREIDGGMEHIFARTRPLSAYISAIIAGEWAVVDAGTWTGCDDFADVSIPLRIMCRRSLAGALDADDIEAVTRHGFTFFHEHYRFAYPWGKYDQVFVPEYNLGAMENPGLITFNENYLSRGTLTVSQKQKRANTILHEMCHMWFGDLVTPRWWDDLWLKESFAENQGTSAIAAGPYPDEWANFAVGRQAWAYEQDQLPTTHPIAATIPDVAAAKTHFDGITYAKGAAVLKQLVAWVGEDAFDRGAREYFRAHAYGSATLTDLLAALEQATGESLEEWKRAWLETSGPSVLSATYSVGANGAINNFTLRQVPTDEARTIRPHQLDVSTWALKGGVLERSACFHVRLTAESALIDPDGVLSYAGAVDDVALIVINDGNLTYAISRLNALSTDTALEYLSTCPDAVTRAVVWASLFASMRDGLLDPRRLASSCITSAVSEPVPAIRDRLLAMAHETICQFCSGEDRSQLRAHALTLSLETMVRNMELDELTAWRRFAVSMFTGATGDLGVAAMRSLAEDTDLDIAWKARCALAARGLMTPEELAAFGASDSSGHAHRELTRASAALPSVESRERAWERLLGEELSNEELSATLDGLNASVAYTPEDTRRVIDHLEDYWNSHSIGLGIRYVRGALNVSVDVQDNDSVALIIGGLEHWLDSCHDAPAQLRRLVLEKYDALTRAARVQEKFS